MSGTIPLIDRFTVAKYIVVGYNILLFKYLSICALNWLVADLEKVGIIGVVILFTTIRSFVVDIFKTIIRFC